MCALLLTQSNTCAIGNELTNKLCACSAIDPEEKTGIKSTLLLQSFSEPVPQIAIQMAVLIGNISRLDYPNDWDDVSYVIT